MEECGILVHKLGKILDTIKKNPNRKFKLNTLKKKQDDAKDTYNRILQLTQTIKIDECTILLKASRNIYEEVKTLLNAKLILPKLISFKTISLIVLNCIRSYSKNKKIKMTTPVEIIKTLPLLIPQYSGEGDKLNSIIAALNASKVLITNDNRAVALQVILSRFEGKARSAVGDNPATVDVIIEKLKEKCKVTVAPETVVAKLNATKQNGEISKFTEQIEKLTLELERAYISEDVPVETASRMAVKAGVKALASGVKNNETRLLLKAGQFSTLSSAVEKLTENEPTNVNTGSVLSYSSQYQRNNSNNYPRYQNNYNRNRGNGNFQDRRNDGYNQRSYQNSNRGYNRGHYNNRGNSRGNYHNYGRNNYNQNRTRQGRQVFYAQAENLPVPQQIPVGGQQIVQQPIQQQQPQPQRQIASISYQQRQ